MPVAVSRALGGTVGDSESLPEVPHLVSLYGNKVGFRRGQVHMIVGQPGSQKSGFVMWLCGQLNLPTLYFAFDMHPTTVFTRMASMVTGDTGDTVVEGLRSGARDYYSEQLEESNIHFVFDTEGDLQDVADELDAFVEIYDEFPAVIVLDNLMDLVGEGDDAAQSYTQTMKDVQRLARVTGSAVFVLHHVTEGIGDPRFPSPRKAILQKASQKPELILSVALDGLVFRVAAVKNRSGKQDATGKDYIELAADPERTRFSAYHRRY